MAALLARAVCRDTGGRGGQRRAPMITSLTVAQAIAQLAARTITPLQLTEAYLERIATMNPSLNAFITVTADHARARRGA